MKILVRKKKKKNNNYSIPGTHIYLVNSRRSNYVTVSPIVYISNRHLDQITINGGINGKYCPYW